MKIKVKPAMSTEIKERLLDKINRENSALYAFSDELLLKIFEFLTDQVLEGKRLEEKKLTASIINVSQVCSRFKALVNDHIIRKVPISKFDRQLLIESRPNPLDLASSFPQAGNISAQRDPRNPFEGLDISKLFP